MLSRLSLLLLAAAGCWASEIRGVWIARDSLGSRERIRSTMQTLADANFNVAYVLAWSQGYPLYKSTVFEKETGIVSDPQYGGRDVLQEAIDEAKPLGITVIPWLEYGFVAVWSGRLRGDSLGPILDKHPDWLAKNRAGESKFPIPGGAFYYWMVHTHPDAQQFLIDMMKELIANYDVPGVQFDRARYPDLDCGYDDQTRQLYAAENEGRQPPDNPRDPAWVRWRAGKLSRFLIEAQRQLKTVNWRTLFTNAPVPTPDGYNAFAQDPPSWVRDRSHDFLTPQIYWRDPDTFKSKLDLHIRTYEDASRLVPGVAVDVSDPRRLVQIIETVRAAGLQGVVIWYYEDLQKSQAFDLLKATVFSEKAPLPWK
ncbi:MAG: hypothetical protein FJW30_28490 [Acidobacteria bacterium]|nr:hypothetical protein [Acidobacteriota bacterium]